MLRDKVEIGLDDELIKRLEQGRKQAFAPPVLPDSPVTSEGSLVESCNPSSS
jgi:hypothetical protein